MADEPKPRFSFDDLFPRGKSNPAFALAEWNEFVHWYERETGQVPSDEMISKLFAYIVPQMRKYSAAAVEEFVRFVGAPKVKGASPEEVNAVEAAIAFVDKRAKEFVSTILADDDDFNFEPPQS